MAGMSSGSPIDVVYLGMSTTPFTNDYPPDMVFGHTCLCGRVFALKDALETPNGVLMCPKCLKPLTEHALCSQCWNYYKGTGTGRPCGQCKVPS